MPVNFPKDTNGTDFDPSIHNLLNETAQPQLSSKGNFVKLKEGESNPADVISRFIDSLADDLTDDAIAVLAGEPEQETTAPTDEQPSPPAEDPQSDEEPEETVAGIAVEDSEDDIPDLTPEELASTGIIIEDAEDDDAEEEEEPEETIRPKKQPASSYKGELSVDLILSIQDQARALDTRADFSKGYNLTGINLAGKDLRAAMFNNCNLDGANLSGANLMGVNFTGASLKGANLKGACLKYAIFPVELRNDCLMDEYTDLKGVSK